MPAFTDPILFQTEQGKNVPCRTCTDFKTWAKQQKDVMGTGGNGAAGGVTTRNVSEVPSKSSSADSSTPGRNCPVDKDELGKSTWNLLHTMAANYPETPGPCQVKDMTVFFSILSQYYPCEYCAKDFQEEIKSEPVNATSQEAFSQWLCKLHNKVNFKLGKPEFDCSKVNERWRDGWKDGSCDM